MKKWSEEAWDVARPTYLKIIEHPFVEELARGTLAADKFLFYLRQDSLYLAHYSRVLTHFPSYREGAHRGFHPLRFGRHRGRGGAARLLPERRRTGSRRDQPDMPALHLGTASPGHSPGRSGSRCRASLLLGLSAGRAADHRPAAGKWESLCTVDRDLRRSLLHRSDFAGYRNLRRTGRKNRAGNPAPDDRHLPALYQDGVAVLGQRLVSGKLENIKSVHSSKCANNLINKINYEKTL